MTTQDLARAAQLAFPRMRPVVEPHGGGAYTLRPMPWGRTGLFQEATDARIWVAAEKPPPPTTDPAKVPPRIRRLADELGLIPWCRIETTDHVSAIRRLGQESQKDNRSDHETNWLLLPPPPQQELIGDTPVRIAQQLGALLTARVAGAPIPCLWGGWKVGKRAIAAQAAARASLTIRGELHLRQIAWDSVLQNGLEKVTETLNDLASRLQADEVVLVSDAHLLSMIEPMRSVAVRDEIVLQTMADLPFRVILIATRDAFPASTRVLSLQTPGLEGPSEVLAFLDSTYHGQISLQREAVDILMRAAMVESDAGHTIAPGRITYLIELARALSPESESEKVMLVPDDIVPAASLVGPVWTRFGSE